MTILELPPLTEPRRPEPPAAPEQASSAPIRDSWGGILQFQLQRLLGEVLADPDLAPRLYVTLGRHMAAHPGHPERALLAHLREVQDMKDLPPFHPGRQP